MPAPDHDRFGGASSDALGDEAAQRLCDEAGETPRARATLGLIAAQFMCEVFDFFLAGFVVSVVATAWRLTFGQTAIIFLAAGFGTLLGSAVFGRLADRFGRKPVFVGCACVSALSAGAIALIPEHGWMVFAGLRLLVGIGFSGAGMAQIAYVSETAPRRQRALIGGLTQAPISVGLLLSALSASLLLPSLGWRGLAALGAAPVLVALALAVVAPESIRWQVMSGRLKPARAMLERLLRRPIDEAALAAPILAPSHAPAPPLTLLGHRRVCAFILIAFFSAGLAANGVLLWGPTILANVLRVSPARAAGGFVFVSLAGIVGRLLFTAAPHWLGRRRSGQIMGFGGGLTLAAAGLWHDGFLFGASAFLLAIIAAALFFDGGSANLQPYPPELLPTRLGASGVGLAQGSAGVARMLSPVVLALIAGQHNLISPRTTSQAVLPAMLCLAAAMTAVGLAFTFLSKDVTFKARPT